MSVLDPIIAHKLKDTADSKHSSSFILKTLLTQNPNTVLVIVAHRGSIASFFNKLGATVNVRHSGILRLSGDQCNGFLQMVHEGETVEPIDKPMKDRQYMKFGHAFKLPRIWPAPGCEVFFIRHGTSMSNMVVGVPDGDLIWEGEEQAEDAGDVLAELIPEGKDVHIISSGMIRAVHTSHIIHDHLLWKKNDIKQ